MGVRVSPMPVCSRAVAMLLRSELCPTLFPSMGSSPCLPMPCALAPSRLRYSSLVACGARDV